MHFFICLLAIYGLAFLIKESSGPFNIIGLIRNWLMNNKYFGVFFYKLLSCYFCLGCYCGMVIYFLHVQLNQLTIGGFIIWTLVGGAWCYLVNSVIERINLNGSNKVS